ncbi:MAG: hypothetical protein V4603_02820, partial [Pseudomonadota bacterium]
MNAIKHARIPVSLIAATVLTAGLFSALQTLTEATFIPVATKSIPIDFKQVRPDTPTAPKQIEKPVLREPPPIDDILPPRTGEGGEEFDVVMRDPYVPTVIPGDTPTFGGSDR